MSYSRPGRSMAGNLTGLLGSIGDTIGEMGGPGEQYVDTFRRSMAPEADLGDSQSLLNYSEWAKRNGYDDEAEKYLALGYKQKAVEGEKAYKTRVATDTEKLRGFKTSIGNLEQAVTGGDVNAEIALEKVKDAQRQHITAMNKFGADNDYGIGNEGGVAVRKYEAEILAAEKAALERNKTATELAAAQLELQDAVMQAKPIDLASIPPNLQEQYAGLRDRALEGDAPEAAMRNLNKRWGEIADNYLSEIAKGDKATTALLWQAASDIRNNSAYDDDVKEWVRDNPEQVSKAIEQAEASLTGNTEYRTAGPEKKQQMSEEALMKVLRGQRADFDEIVVEAQGDLEDQSREDTAKSKHKERDRVLQYKPGYEQGGAEYKKYLASAKEALGEEFDQSEFDRNWDKKFFSPGGAIAPTSATGSVMRKGPYG